jgi:Fic family protein
MYICNPNLELKQMDMIRPYFHVSNEMMNLVAEISEQIGVLSDGADARTTAYRPPYDVMSEVDFLRAHSELSEGQTGRVGEYSADDRMVPHLMAVLFSWVAQTDVHPLISSCVFHYGLEYIHPFTDGNGRMGRYWQTALLSSWRAQMAWVPGEEIVRDRQDAYYGAISDADRTGDARRFIEFMLLALRDALVDVKRSVEKGVVKSVVKILDLIAQNPDITRERLAREVGLSVRGVEKNLAQLKSEGKIVRVGGRKGGHWEVAKGTRSKE